MRREEDEDDEFDTGPLKIYDAKAIIKAPGFLEISDDDFEDDSRFNFEPSEELIRWADSLSRDQLKDFIKMMRNKQINWRNLQNTKGGFSLNVDFEEEEEEEAEEEEEDETGSESNDIEESEKGMTLDLPSESSSPPRKRPKKSFEAITNRSLPSLRVNNNNNNNNGYHSDAIELTLEEEEEALNSPSVRRERNNGEKEIKEEKVSLRKNRSLKKDNNTSDIQTREKDKKKRIDQFKSASQQYDLIKSSLLKCSSQQLKLDHEKEKQLEDFASLQDKINEYKMNELVKGDRIVKSSLAEIIDHASDQILQDEELLTYLNQFALPEGKNERKEYLSRILVDPSEPNIKPFLSDQKIKDILSNKRANGLYPITTLQDGDPVHIPFSEKERELVKMIERDSEDQMPGCPGFFHVLALELLQLSV
eukprot:TRINITY_DN3084_c0_g1_i2.p1 TRINITY_DN3084_c0_g1~~TRINITY_DN3084_c0_g1_i2.p1  ORF type:complete len:421 (+),score=201.23 TRINITY_DN3084_c0_g1_i2:115-1377(+)